MNESILQEAQRLVYGDRGASYGHPADDYARVVDIFRAVTGVELTPWQGVQFMRCVKLSRQAHDPTNRDNYTDEAGYADCSWQIIEREQHDLLA